MVVELLGESLPLVLLVVGVLLAVAEAVAPGAHLIVLGVALIVAGLAGLLVSPLASPIALAILVVLVGAVSLVAYRELDLYGGKGAGRTSDSSSLKGSTGRVTERVSPTDGEIKLDNGGFNPYYSARSFEGDIAEGQEVIVIDPGGGNVVTVEAMGAIENDRIDRELALNRERTEEDQRERTDRNRERAEHEYEES